jgi:hypothetical protein
MFKKILMDQVHAGGGIEAVDELTMAPLALFRDLEECDSGLKQVGDSERFDGSLSTYPFPA